MVTMLRSALKPQQVFFFGVLTINTFLKSLAFSTLSKSEGKHPVSSSSSSSDSDIESELKIICKQVQGRSEDVIALFKLYGFSPAEILSILGRRHCIITLNPEKILQPKLAILSDNGISTENITRLICANPYILCKSLDTNIAPCIQLLKSFFPISSLSVRQLNIGLSNFSKAVLPNMDTLRKQSIPHENVQKLFEMNTRDMLRDADKMREAKEMGLHTLSVKYLISIMKSAEKNDKKK